jgi:haloalkane dehalogenase
MKTLSQDLQEVYTFQNYLLDKGKGNRIHHVDESEGDADVILHGHPTWAFSDRNLIRELSSTFRCIAIDNMRYGAWDNPQDDVYRLVNYITNAQKVIEHLQLRQFHFLLHDQGCAVGMAPVERWPECVESPTIMNGAAFHSSQISFHIDVCKLTIISDLLIRGLSTFVWGANCMATTRILDSVTERGYRFPDDSWRSFIMRVKRPNVLSYP